jgi:hypothetical protein
MKKVFTLLAFVCICGAGFSQYQRLVLFEEFTQASCGPCASQNPGFNTLLNDNLDKATSLKYQVWWPGYDPMYLDNETDVNDRVSYYSVLGVPDARIDGSVVVNDCSAYDGAPACVDQADIDEQYAVTSPLLVEVTHSFSSDYLTINVHVDVTAGADVTGDLKLQVAITERNLFWPSAPGTNGEVDFYNVMKKMLPDASGTSTGDFTSGETKSYDFSWTLDYIYLMNELQVVAFVQDDDTKDVLQSGLSEPNTEFPDFGIASSSAGIQCEGTTLSPVVTISNNTDDVLSALDITYSIDGGATETYSWTGAISGGASTDVTIPEVDFGTSGTHSFEASFSLPAGIVDGNSFNNDAKNDINVFSVTFANVDEGFEDDNNFPPVNWGLVNTDLGTGWSLIKTEGAYDESDNSAKADFYSIPSGSFDLYTPKMDLSAYSSAISLTFDRAYAKYSNSYVDYLNISLSADCGESWEEIYTANSSDLETADPTTASFKPQDDEWATDEIDLTDYAGVDELLFKFTGVSGFGNNLYVDNIRISAPVAIDDAGLVGGINLTPNPATATTTLELSLLYANALTIKITDVAGRTIYEVTSANYSAGTHYIPMDVTSLADGMYFVNVSGKGVNQTLKLNIVK